MLATCPQQVVRVGLVEFEERHDTRTNGQHYKLASHGADTDSRPIRPTRLYILTSDTRDFLARKSVSVLHSTTPTSRIEDATRKLLPWNLCLTER